MKRISAALLLVLALSGCAVTGQPAQPGTAAVFDGNTVTNSEVAAWATALQDLGFRGRPGDALTLLLLQPAADQASVAAGNAATDDKIKQDAINWALAAGKTITDVTADQIAVVRTVRALATQAVPTDTQSVTFSAPVLDAVAGIQARAKVSPEYGDFSQARFENTLAAAIANAGQYANAPGSVSYLVLKSLNGFDPNAQQEWMGATTPTAQASA